MRRDRKTQIRDEKGQHVDHMTSGELARFLGITPRALRKRIEAGTVPPAAAVTLNGWKLWSPAQQQALITREARHRHPSRSRTVDPRHSDS